MERSKRKLQATDSEPMEKKTRNSAVILSDDKDTEKVIIKRSQQIANCTSSLK